MRLIDLLGDYPLLALFVVTSIIVLLSYEGGYRAGR
jgi:hypothetical protein